MRVPEELQTQEELWKLVQRSRNGEEKAKQEIMYRLRPLVVSILRRKGHGTDTKSHGEYGREALDDMTMTAWEGVWEIVQQYDPRHEAGLSIWKSCYWRVNNKVNVWMANNSGGLPMTYWAWQKAPGIDLALNDAQVNWQELSDARLVEITGVSSTRQILEARRKLWQLDPEKDDTVTESAEEAYMSTTETDLQDTLNLMRGWLDFGQRGTAEGLAWDYVDRQEYLPSSEVDTVDTMLKAAWELV